MESGKAYWRNDRWIIIPDRQPNLEHIETLNGGQIDGVPVVYDMEDRRKARPRQRALFSSPCLVIFITGLVNQPNG